MNHAAYPTAYPKLISFFGTLQISCFVLHGIPTCEHFHWVLDFFCTDTPKLYMLFRKVGRAKPLDLGTSREYNIYI